ncbi:OmpA family protein [Chlorogloeopsis sp. ULAP01]|uniref:OmpA family protein n=1 Tax=Chlorogloeopsis sp. ULAP01 TaxID=3056483 RepID=UPI0025AAA2CC|nr:OmpA family protein [Chlorogloeopsis sp. ULAP01]MDM9380291.1 OmpA family protein [Chlorogloeopsis sp. ULAP01]
MLDKKSQNSSTRKMHSFRFLLYLLAVTFISVGYNFILRATAKSEDDLKNVQLSATKIREFKISQVPTPSVQFPKNIFLKVKLSEIGCEKIQVQENEYLTIITLPADLVFNSDENKIRPQAEKTLRQVSQAINNRYPDTWLQILGHTDSIGSRIENLKLSEQRVTALQQWLSQKGGVKISLMTKEGYGETQPIAPNTKSDGSDNPKGRQKNRRIEIVVQKQANQV